MTIEELQKQLEEEKARTKALENSNARLVDESKGFKTRAQEAEEKITLAEKEKLQSQGKLDELLANEKEENKRLKLKLENNTKLTLKEKLRAETAKYAKDAHDVDMILKVMEHKDLLKIDEDNLTIDGTENFVNAVRESHSYLFKKKNLDNGDGKTPKGNEGKSDEEKYLQELDLCNSRKELDALKKKYNRK